MKTILILSLHVSKWGAERSMCSLAAYLKKKYRVVFFITSHGSIEELLKQYELEYYVVPLVSSSYIGNIKWWKFIILKAQYYAHLIRGQYIIERELKKKRISPSLLYTNTIIPINGFLLNKKYRIPHICHIREFYDEDFHFKSWIRRKKLNEILNKYCTRYICISNAIKKKYVPILGEEKLIRIYNGLPINQKVVHDFTKEVFNVLFVGRFSSEKNQIEAVRAIHILVNAGEKISIDFYGSGKDEINIRKYINDNQLENFIHLCGYADDVDYSKYHLGVICSPFEGFGRVTVDYMLASLPVIGANSGATPELIDEGITGFLYTVGNTSELSKLIFRYMSNRSLAQMHGEAGYERALRYFSEKKYFEDIESVIEQVVKD